MALYASWSPGIASCRQNFLQMLVDLSSLTVSPGRTSLLALGLPRERSDPASGKPQIDIVLVFAELLGTIEELALLLFNPPGLRDHPFRRDRP
jgi:hypothetical protein